MTRLSHWVRFGLLSIFLMLAPALAAAAPYAALVMDARTGEVLYSTNADTRLHPASLTKMMTLYIAFEAVEHGEISLDTMVTISSKAAGEQPSRLGLRTGQKIALRYLIRAAAIKSANDAATAIAEAISGSVPAFAERMTRTATALGMKNTTFRNANGLTESGHLSTARDLTVLGRRLFYDYPEYYNLFSRRSADAGMATVTSTNRAFLDSYEGADGIKTGYTSAAGFNLTASAERGGKRIIATVLGGTSTPQRNAKMTELLNLGFSKAPSRVREIVPTPPVYVAQSATPASQGSAGAKVVRVSGAVQTSPRPTPRAIGVAAAIAEAAPVEDIDVATAEQPPAPPSGPSFAPSEAPQPETLALVAAPLTAPEPLARPLTPDPEERKFTSSEPPQPETIALAAVPEVAEIVALAETMLAAAAPAPSDAPIAAETAVADEQIASAESTDAALPETLSPLLLDHSPRPIPAPNRTPPEPVAIAQTEPQAPVPAVEPAPEAVQIASAQPTAPDLPAPAAAAANVAALDTPAAPPIAFSFSTSEHAQPETLLMVSDPLLPTANIDAATLSAPEVAPKPAQSPLAVGVILTANAPPAPAPAALPEVVSRVSTSGNESWGISVGKYSTSYLAERALLQTALMEAESLGDAKRKVASRSGGFDATFVGMSQELAEMACRRLAARQSNCTLIAP